MALESAPWKVLSLRSTVRDLPSICAACCTKRTIRHEETRQVRCQRQSQMLIQNFFVTDDKAGHFSLATDNGPIPHMNSFHHTWLLPAKNWGKLYTWLLGKLHCEEPQWRKKRGFGSGHSCIYCRETNHCERYVRIILTMLCIYSPSICWWGENNCVKYDRWNFALQIWSGIHIQSCSKILASLKQGLEIVSLVYYYPLEILSLHWNTWKLTYYKINHCVSWGVRICIHFLISHIQKGCSPPPPPAT